MKILRKTIALVLTIAISAAVLAIPAFAYVALPSEWSSKISGFEEICRNVDPKIYGDYILALQRYLMCFDYVCKQKLYYNGGYMDGDFGGRTEAAVIYLQGQFSYASDDIDGIVGSQTWGSIARSLKLYPENYDRIRRPNGVPGQWVFIIAPSDGFYNLAYFSEDNLSTAPI